MKPKKCKACGEKFTPTYTTTQRVCSPKCALDLAKTQRDKRKLAETKAFRANFLLNDRSHQLKLAQKAFNKFIRLRDKDDPCISCGRHHKGQYHAGHYRSVGSAPHLRFNELNVSKQCSACNNHLSGNIAQYRIGLINKIGIENVEWLESNNDAKKYSIEEIIEIKKKYLKLCRELES